MNSSAEALSDHGFSSVKFVDYVDFLATSSPMLMAAVSA